MLIRQLLTTGIPNCFNSIPALLCRLFTSSLTRAAYSPLVQSMLTPAQYWHDPLQEEVYRKKSAFAALYNNERDFNATYRENLLKGEQATHYYVSESHSPLSFFRDRRIPRFFFAVNTFVLFRNTEDEVIVPRESPHFAFYREGQRTEIVNFTSTNLYKKDLIGLKKLFTEGRLIFREVPGRHMQSPDGWLAGITSEYFMD